MDKKNVSENKKYEKFFFNMNIFDDENEDHIEESEHENNEQDIEESLPPLPPMFTEDEVEAIRKKAFETGREQGVQETKSSRSEHIKQVLDAISQTLDTVQKQEHQREKRYEEEVISLTTDILHKLFPSLTKQLGPALLQDHLLEIISQQKEQDGMKIAVHPDSLEGIQKFMTTMKEKTALPNVTVIADDTLTENGCNVFWAGGGATYSLEGLYKEIDKTLKGMLAGTNTKSHDNKAKEKEIAEDPDE